MHDRQPQDGLVEAYGLREFLGPDDDIGGSSERVWHVNLREPSLRRGGLQQFDTVSKRIVDVDSLEARERLVLFHGVAEPL